MHCIKHHFQDPHFNIALEEYLLHHHPNEVVMLWESSPAVVIGKHQNAFAEVNLPFIRRHGIPVVRRLSGGGTVFHAPGNLNFTFLLEGEPGNMVNFRKYTAPVIDFLNKMGIPARFAGKNDIRAGELKISGNAEHVYKKRVLHHGTLLYDADLETLREAIRVEPGKYRDRSVQSVRSPVANITDLLEKPLAFDRFREMLSEHLVAHFAPVAPYTLTEKDLSAVKQLVRDKYGQDEWNYAWSPTKYYFTGQASLNGHPKKLELDVKNGTIQSARFPDQAVDPAWRRLEHILPGTKHLPAEVTHVLNTQGLLPTPGKEIPDKLLPLFF